MKQISMHVLATIVAIVLSVIDSIYMIYLRVPSIIQTRPEIAEVGFVTGMFSDKAMTYLYYHYETQMIVISSIMLILIFNVVIYTHK